MLFNSIEFLIFLPITILLYFLFPKKYRHYILLVASYFFYAYWNWYLLFLILGTTLVAYLSGIIFSKVEKKNLRVLTLVFSIVVILGILLFFKYTNFVLDSISNLLLMMKGSSNISLLNIILPVGISFYTFQTLSYVIDIYQNKIEPEKDFAYFALYVSFFPQLVAGPIERPERLLPQLKSKEGFNVNNASIGFKYMLVGFVKKIVVADMIGVYASRIFNNLQSTNGVLIIIGTILFSIQILCDFAGYTDIAIGVAKIFNIDLMKNFDHPYKSKSIKEFWNRWHISLSTWLRDYIYFPLGGSRVSKARWALNILVVFLVSGIWHGAAWTYVLWGLLHGIYQIVEKFLLPLTSKIKDNLGTRILRVVITYILVCFAWIAFRANSFQDMLLAYKTLFTSYAFSSNYFELIKTTFDSSFVSVIIVVTSVIIFNTIDYTLLPTFNTKVNKYLRYAIYIICIWLVMGCFIYERSSGAESSFIYFQF